MGIQLNMFRKQLTKQFPPMFSQHLVLSLIVYVPKVILDKHKNLTNLDLVAHLFTNWSLPTSTSFSGVESHIF